MIDLAPALKSLRDALALRGFLPIKSKHVTFEAGVIAREQSIDAAVAFLIKYGTDEQQRVEHLLRANSARNDAEWQSHMDAFLAQWNVAPIKLRPGPEKIFTA